jgi:hypothetical protein
LQVTRGVSERANLDLRPRAYPKTVTDGIATSPNIIWGNGMTSKTLTRASSIRERIDIRVDRNTQPNITALNSFAVGSLVSLFDEKEKLFSRRVILAESGLRQDRVSAKLTAIALLGLQRLAESGASNPFDIASIQDAVWKDRSWVKGIGDLGLLTWFTATCRPDRLGSLFQEYDFSRAIATYPDAREGRTDSVAWFLAGIAHARLANPSASPDLTDVAVDTYHLLEDNQGDGELFGHAAFRRYVPHSIRNRFGTFADQIHAIYALTTFAQAFQIEEPLGSALGCANSLRALQGTMGQWWFLYERHSCRVINRYPVFSLNQYGLAPVGFLALEEATGQSFHDSVYKGMCWNPGEEYVGKDVRNLDQPLNWDSIRPLRALTKYWEAALSLMNIYREPRVEDLGVRFENRPDHSGWLLYAFGRLGLTSAASKVKAAATH